MESGQSPEVEHIDSQPELSGIGTSVESEQSPEVEQAQPEPEQLGTVARQSGCGDASGSLLEPESALTAELLPAQPKRVSAGPAGLVAVVRPYRGTGAAVQPTHDLWVDLPQESLPPSHRQGAVQPTHDLWVGWSSDGVEWEWQDATEIFGVNDPQLSIQLAVGGDFVLAYVSVSDEPSRWFIAEVPGS